MDIKYRKFKISDLKIVSKLIQNFYREDPSYYPASPRKIQKTFNSLTSHPDLGTIMVLEYEKEIIGYSILINFWSNEFGGNIVFIDEIYIKKTFRSQGIGTNFIRYLMKSKFGNSIAMHLEVTPNNKRARKLYKSIGFKLYKNSLFLLDYNDI